jgi:CheY-like chemotaxis protein
MDAPDKARILIVDDDAPVSELLSRWLSSEGYGCAVAEDGPSALKELESGCFDVALLDVMMPGMSGIDLMTIMKPLFSEVAVVFVTAVDDKDTAMLASDLGAYAYILKPFEKSEIMFAVAGALERNRLRTLLKQTNILERESRLIEARYRDLISSLPVPLAEFALQAPTSRSASDDEFYARLGGARLSLANIPFARSVGADSLEPILGKSVLEVIGDDSELKELSRLRDPLQVAGEPSVDPVERPCGRNGWRNMFFGHGPEDYISRFWVIRLPQETRDRSGASQPSAV